MSTSSKLIFAPGENQQPNETDPSHTPQRAAQFQIGTLHRHGLSNDPIQQFHTWFSDSRIKSSVPETVCLSTSSLPSGRVSSRMVYLKELDTRGFVIYSNWGTSRKAADISSNTFASLCFWWKPTERQVRVEGVTEFLKPEESQVYFDTRARGSRIGAWASQQSNVLKPGQSPNNTNTSTTITTDNKTNENEDDGRAELDSQVHEIEQRFDGQDHIPVPPFWGGVRIVPDVIEFWQGRDSRLHDRFRYTKTTTDGWKVERLSP